MKWIDFVINVQKWARERGIYEHSTPDAQLLKALSEVGELADAYIKGDKEALADAIGDVAVCVVNYSHMIVEDDIFVPTDGTGCDSTAEEIGFICLSMGEILADELVDSELKDICTCLNSIAKRHDLDFLECCEKAWNAIKYRKGKMVAGGAFVKEGD